MSAISLKSITGITSITTPAGIDNQLTLHNNNTTEAVKLDIAGNLHFHNHLNITGISTAANFKTGTSNLHNTGLNVFDLDVDGHTNLDNVSIAGVTTMTGNLSMGETLTISGNNPNVTFTDTNSNPDYKIYGSNGAFTILDSTNGVNRFAISSTGNISISNDLDVDGHTNLDNVSIAGVVTATGAIETTGSELKITGAEPRLTFTDTDNNPDFQIWANAQRFSIYDNTNNETRLRINSGGEVLIGTTTGTGHNLTVQDSGTSTTAGGNIVARFQSNGSGRDATIQLSDNVANSATISMLSSALILKQSGTETVHITSAGRVLIGDSAATSLLSVGGTNYNWDQGDTPMVLIKGHNNEAPTSGSENIAFQIEDENNNLIHKVWNTGGGNSDVGKVYYAGQMGIGDLAPTTKVNIKIASSTQWSSSKNVSNTTNLDFLALDLINTDNNTNSEVGLMMEAGSSGAAQMTISTKKVSASYAELAIRTRDGGSASKEIWKIRGNGKRYVRTGATLDIVGGTESASITPNNGDYIDFARVNYAGAAMGEIFIKWTSVVAPACCHHGSAHLRIGTEYHTYFYGWNDWVDVVSSAAHNSGWFSHWRLRRVVVSGTSYLYLQGKWNGSNVSAGSFQVTIGKSAYHPNGSGLIEALTPVVDNNENGDTSGSKTYMAVQAQVQGRREKDSPAVSGDRITKSHSGRFHAYLGLSSHGEISAYNQPRMSANKNAGQTYTTTPTIVTYGNEHFDNGNDYNPSTSTYTCPMDGVYYVSYSTNVDAYSNWQYLECRVNGSAAFTHTRIMHLNFPRLTLQGSNFVNCAQGDEIAIYGWVGSGTNGGDNFGLFQVYMLS